MPFKLSVQSLHGGEASNKEYDQPSVLLGRHFQCDVVLQDMKSLVSREHAKIQRTEGKFYLIDLKSRNKTVLNQRTLTSGEEYPLEENDEICIGDFKLVITSIQSPIKVLKKKPKPSLKQTQNKDKKIDNAVFSELKQVFVTHRHESSEVRKIHLLDILREAVTGVDVEQSEKLLTNIELFFQGSPSDDQKVTQVLRDEEDPLQKSQTEIWRKSYESLVKLSESYVDRTDPMNSKEEVDQFVARVDRVLSVMFASLANAQKGRRQFEQEFDVEATRILGWNFNPVKECGTGKEIGTYLLDWNNEPSIDKSISHLEEGFNDLSLHHLGLIAGLNECLRGLLDQLLPDTFEVESQKPESVSLWMRPFIRYEPFRSWAAWKQFRKKYKALREEEVKTFETILGPFIAKGWLSVQKKK